MVRGWYGTEVGTGSSHSLAGALLLAFPSLPERQGKMVKCHHISNGPQGAGTVVLLSIPHT